MGVGVNAREGNCVCLDVRGGRVIAPLRVYSLRGRMGFSSDVTFTVRLAAIREDDKEIYSPT